MARLIRKCKRRDRIEGLENVTRSRNQCAAKRGIEVILLGDLPADQLVGMAIARPMKQALGDGIHEFISVGERFVIVKPNKLIELIYSSYVVVLDFGINRVFPFAAPGFPRCCAPAEGGRRSTLQLGRWSSRSGLTTTPSTSCAP